MSGKFKGNGTADGKGGTGNDADKAIELAVVAVGREILGVGGGGRRFGRHLRDREASMRTDSL